MKNLFKNNRGQISLINTIIIGGLSLLGSFFTASATANNNLAQVKNSVDIVEEREKNHYAEIEKTLERIEKKIDDQQQNKK